jgi:hypothetical protein
MLRRSALRFSDEGSRASSRRSSPDMIVSKPVQNPHCKREALRQICDLRPAGHEKAPKMRRIFR